MIPPLLRDKVPRVQNTAEPNLSTFLLLAALYCSPLSCPVISYEKRNILLDVIRNENINELDNESRSDGIVWSWRRL